MFSYNYFNDRTVDSTDNNEYAGDSRDENVWEENIIDTELPEDEIVDSEIGDILDGDRPLYEEEGYRKDAGT